MTSIDYVTQQQKNTDASQTHQEDHILSHKTNQNKLKRMEIKHYLLSGHKMKLEMDNRKIPGKSKNTWRLNNILLNYMWIKEEISREIFKYFERNESENEMSKSVGCSENNA